MKKYLSVLLLALIPISAFTQTVIPNGDFEQWTTLSFETPQYYPQTSNSECFFRYQLPANVTNSTDAYNGSHALSLATTASATDTVVAYFINTQPSGGPSSWHGGMAYNEKPTSFKGHYKYNVEGTDSATIIIAFSKEGVNIGTYFLRIGGLKEDWTLFDIALTPALSATPDSVVLGALSCKFDGTSEKPIGPVGSTLLLDSIAFGGVATQPAKMNGDFEDWDTKEFSSADEWYSQSDDNNSGIAKTADSNSGSYAIELSTYKGDSNGKTIARNGHISKGYYPNNCNGNCYQLGGIPFENKIDTLSFYYKYSPSSTDTAAVNLTFKKGGNTIGGREFRLLGSENYQYTEVPFDLGQTPDSVIVEFTSSLWNHQDLAYVGSVLIVDDVNFKTLPIATSLQPAEEATSFAISPNPSSGFITIAGLADGIKSLEVLDISGQAVFNGKLFHNTTSLDLSNLPKGVYFIQINDAHSTQSQKIVIQ